MCVSLPNVSEGRVETRELSTGRRASVREQCGNRELLVTFTLGVTQGAKQIGLTLFNRLDRLWRV